jgi:SNF2 family DNA or RNA helicase
MGLGKTVQALALLLDRGGPSLVVCPTSVCFNWLEEARRFAPSLNLATLGRNRAAQIEALGPQDVLVVSYGLLNTCQELLEKVSWEVVILDEAQLVKNARAKRAQAASALQAKARVALTGTPVENHLGDLCSLFRFLNPGLLGGEKSFAQRFARPIEEGNRAAAHCLKRLISPFVLRRLKSQVLDELPPRTEIPLYVQLDDEERALYEAARQRASESLAQRSSDDPEAFHVLAELTRLRRLCCHPRLVMPESQLPGAKLQAVLQLVDELRENRHRALVFSQFVDHLQLLRGELDARGIPYRYLDGSTPAADRPALVREFQSGKGDLFLISLKAGGAGLNLTAADYVIHLDPWWNPAVEDQASDRAHRLGQQRPVTVYRMIARDTVEERIVDLHRHKRALADQLLSGQDGSSRLNVDELLALLRQT